MSLPVIGLILTPLVIMAAPAGDSVCVPHRGWARDIADTFLKRHPGCVTYDAESPASNWNYEQCLFLLALTRLWEKTQDHRYVDFVRDNLMQYVDSTGTIRTYERDAYNLDNIAGGRVLLTLYHVTGDQRWKHAADSLREQLRHQPRTTVGGFWHKKIYPNQMWLDGLFMAEPFYAMYGVLSREDSAFDDIARQFTLMASHARDAKSGLLYHGWNESRVERWSDPSTGCSPSFWSRSMGWYMMGLVDVLGIMPENDPHRTELLRILNDLGAAVGRYQDRTSGLWYQVMDQGVRQGNYAEASASSMFAYAFAKAARHGWLPRSYMKAAEKAFDGITRDLVRQGKDGLPDLVQTCRAAGLGGRPYRNGTFEYYVSEPRRTNDLKGLGAFLLAAVELGK